MKVLAFKSGKGGALAAVDAEKRSLLFFYEAEKDSFPKNTSATVDTFIDGAAWFDELPDILAISGNSKTGLEYASATGAGYFGIGAGAQEVSKKTFFGRSVDVYSSTHERAHIWMAYGMSPFPQGMPCYVLVWDDVLGDFYEIDETLDIRHLGRVMNHPCYRFVTAYGLADATQADGGDPLRDGDFGRMMSIASLADTTCQDPDATVLIDRILASDPPSIPHDSPFHGIGTEHQRFRDFSGQLSDAIFDRFHDFARKNLTAGHPLLITGEGALNCIWTTRWQDSGIFPDVFVAPSSNDAGCAIGTAVDAMRHFTGRAKLDWSVYSGQPFLDDAASLPGLVGEEADPDAIAAALESGMVIGWARSNCEIGPRALGHRSILAAPFHTAMRDKLNQIKGRPVHSPVAPVCLEEDVEQHFGGIGPSPHMLHLRKVIDPRLRAITHVDGSARIQTVSRAQDSMLYDLLQAFKRRTGVGVLCNTSLNFKGAGFINKTSDLWHFAQNVRLDAFLAGIRFYRVWGRNRRPSHP